MRTRFKTVKSRVILMILAFALGIALLITAFGYYLIFTFNRDTLAEATRANLRLVASIINQDLDALEDFADWCTTTNQVNNYLGYETPAPAAEHPADGDEPGDGEQQEPDSDTTDGEAAADGSLTTMQLRAYWRVREEHENREVKKYINRIIIYSTDGDRTLHISSLTASRTLNTYSLELLEGLDLPMDSAWEQSIADPYSTPHTLVFPIMRTVKGYSTAYGLAGPYNTGDPREILGTVYMAVTPSVITDKFESFASVEGGHLYAKIGGQLFEIAGESMTPVEHSYEVLNQAPGYRQVKTEEGMRSILVQVGVREGMELVHIFPNEAFSDLGGSWFWILAAIILFILVLAVAVILSLDKHISQPVARLRKRVDIIAAGDFSQDPKIESDSEIGEVGRGVNRLALEVVDLMDKRLADEKSKQELEYRMLQSQINPHFIYNTLNSIKWMATLQNATGIAEMTTALSRLLKTVAKDIRKVVPLREELALLDDYFLIQKYRYGGAIEMERDIEDPLLLECAIPRFALQPIVENAIFHGIEPKGSGRVAVAVTREGSDVLISITDNGVGMTQDQIKKVFAGEEKTDETNLRQLGIRSVHDRIRFAFGPEYGLSIASETGKFTTMTIRLPGGDIFMETDKEDTQA